MSNMKKMLEMPSTADLADAHRGRRGTEEPAKVSGGASEKRIEKERKEQEKAAKKLEKQKKKQADKERKEKDKSDRRKASLPSSVEGAKRHLTQALKATKEEKLDGLLRLVQEGDVRRVIKYVKDAAAGKEDRLVNKRDNINCTPLMHAVAHGYYDIARVLIEFGANVDAKGPKNRTALHWAALLGYTNIVQLLISSGATVDVQDEDNITPLQEASFGGAMGVLEELLRAGANPQSRDVAGNTPLHKAAFVGNYDTILRLVQERVELDPMDNLGGTPLHNAIYNNNYDCTTLLLSLGADINQADKKGNSPVRFAVFQNQKKGDGLVLQHLMRSRAVFDTYDQQGAQPIHVAAYKGTALCLAQLLEAGADPNARAKGGMKPVHYAAYGGDLASLVILMGKGADIKAVDAAGNTPLHYAVMKGNVDCASWLLYHHADVNAADKEGKTCLHIAIERFGGPVIDESGESAPDHPAPPASGLSSSSSPSSSQQSLASSARQSQVFGDHRRRSSTTPPSPAAAAAAKADDGKGRGTSKKRAEGVGQILAYGIEDIDEEKLISFCDLLVIKGADPNQPDKNGITPNQMAEMRGLSLMTLGEGMSLKGIGSKGDLLFGGGGPGLGDGGGEGGIGGGGVRYLKTNPPCRDPKLNIDLNDPRELAERVLKEAEELGVKNVWINILRHFLLIPSNRVVGTQVWNLIEKFIHRAVLLLPPDAKDMAKLTYEQFRQRLEKKAGNLTPEEHEELDRIEKAIKELFPGTDTGNNSDSVMWTPPSPVDSVAGKLASIKVDEEPSSSGPPPPPPPGGLPPPPPPPGAMKLDREKLRRFFWTKIPTPQIPGTVFEGMKTDDVPFDKQRLHQLFPIKKGKQLGEGDSAKANKATIFDPKTGMNLEIIITGEKLNVAQFRQRFLSRNADEYPMSLLEGLLKSFPSDDDLKSLSEYKGVLELPPSELFFRELLDIPFLKERMQACLFKMQYQEKASDLRTALHTLNIAIDEVKHNKKLKRILQWVLAIGNYLNGGYFGAQADGFAVSSLLKLTDMRSTDGKTNLMRHLCDEFELKEDQLLTLAYSMPNLGKEYRELLSANTEIANTLKAGLENIGNLVQKCGSVDSSDNFARSMSGFYESNVDIVGELVVDAGQLNEKFNALSKFYGESLGADVVKIVSDFCDQMEKAKEANAAAKRALEAKEERALKARRIMQQRAGEADKPAEEREEPEAPQQQKAARAAPKKRLPRPPMGGARGSVIIRGRPNNADDPHNLRAQFLERGLGGMSSIIISNEWSKRGGPPGGGAFGGHRRR